MAMRRAFRIVSASLVAASLLSPVGATAQQSNFAPPIEASSTAGGGWTLTPSITYSGAWDDNVLVRGVGDEPAEDFLNVVNPRATVDFNGRRGQLSASYDGSFLLYRELSTLNSYDQRGSLYARRLVSPHLALFARGYAAQVPTTELVAFVGVPFVRNGSRIVDAHGGVEGAMSKRTSLRISYDLQWVTFDPGGVGAELLSGGHSQGATASLRHALDPRLTLIADYGFVHAITHPGLASFDGDQAFDIHNGSVGLDYRVSDQMTVFGAAGISRLGATRLSETRIGPSWKAGLSRHFGSAIADVHYGRSYVPVYGFGGTSQDEELTAMARVPLARRVYTSGEVSWRRNDPLVLTAIDLPLRSFWLEAAVGYAVTPTVHVEVFYGGTRQTIDRPGGEMDRNRVGFQVTTSKPMRVR
ncbi:MAG TPA: hypothetical protein VKD69_21330 [Vicinamibacterales bacterium]|nr:hypothetical protein [Vicinamibacterales bacterium]